MDTDAIELTPSEWFFKQTDKLEGEDRYRKDELFLYPARNSLVCFYGGGGREYNNLIETEENSAFKKHHMLP